MSPVSQSTRAIACPAGSGIVAFAGTDNHIRIWDVETPANSYILGAFVGSGVACTHASGAGNKASSSYAVSALPGVQVTQETFEERRPLQSQRGGVVTASPDHAEAITSLACVNVAQDYVLVSGARDGIVKVWK